MYAFGSGTAVVQTRSSRRTELPTTFTNCAFEDNVATGAGGAVDSSSGVDIFFNTSFVGNSAGQGGGALRLAGSASVENCLFVGNIAPNMTGAAVLNLAHVSNVRFSDFILNDFSCGNGEFLDFAPEGGAFRDSSKVCDVRCLSFRGVRMSANSRLARPLRMKKRCTHAACQPYIGRSCCPGG